MLKSRKPLRTITSAMTHRISVFLFFLGLSSSVAVASPDGPVPVKVAKVVEAFVNQTIPLAGSADPLRESEISPRVAGVVDEILVNEGDWVEAGEKILSLDSVIAEIEVASATAKVDEAIARHKDATRQVKEFQSLIDQKAVATTSLESAIADEEATMAAVARQRAELMRHEELLSRHTLTAPFSGVVADKHVEAGQWVDADSAVVKLVALDRIRIRASLPQRYYRQVDLAAAARIIFDALPDKVFSGRPSSLVAVGKQSTRSFPVLFDLDNPDHLIAPGMSARIFIELAGSQTKALLVPRDAVVLKADNSRIVWRVTEADGDSKVKPVKLLTGRVQGDMVEVLDSTLVAGDTIVLLGNENLRPDQAVKLTKTD